MQAAPPPEAKPKSKAGLYVGIGCGCLALVLACCCATGGYFTWQDNRELANPGGDRIYEAAINENVPFTVPVAWSGHGYEFQQVWLDVSGTPDLHLEGHLSCALSGGTLDTDVAPGQYDVKDFTSASGSVQAHVRLGDEYLRSGESSRCDGEVHATRGTVTSMRVYVTERQRPSDYFAK